MTANPDEHKWALDTAEALRNGQFTNVDVSAIAAHIHGIAASLQREIRARFRNAVFFWMCKRSARSQKEFDEIRWIVLDNPSILSAITQEDLDQSYALALDLFETMKDDYDESKLGRGSKVPVKNPYSLDWIMNHDDLPALP